MNLRKDHSCDHTTTVMVGWCTGAKPVLSRLLCVQCTTVVHQWLTLYTQSVFNLLQCAWILSATDVLVHMLMKGAAKCNNHCELQNSVNQLTIERRSALGAFLRACLCQCFHILASGCQLVWTWWVCIKLNVCCIKCYCRNVLDLLFGVVVHTPASWSVWTWHQAK